MVEQASTFNTINHHSEHWKFASEPELICFCFNKKLQKYQTNSISSDFSQRTWQWVLIASNILERNDMFGGLDKNNKI
jgi:hypothetical protein